MARRLCKNCYNKRRREDPNFIKRIFGNDTKRFKSYLSEPDANGCRLWNGCKDKDGYGKFCFRGKVVLSHKFYYEYIRGLTIPSGLLLGHTCMLNGSDYNNSSCVVHCEPMTQKANLAMDATGANHYLALVPDEMVMRVVEFYHTHGAVYSLQRLADLLTSYGYPSSKVCVHNWIHRKGRTAHQDFDAFFAQL